MVDSVTYWASLRAKLAAAAEWTGLDDAELAGAFTDCYDELLVVRRQRDRLLGRCRCAEQTVRNLAMALDGDLREVAYNESRNLKEIIAEVERGEAQP